MLYSGQTVLAADMVALDIARTWQYGSQEFLRNLIVFNRLFVEDEEVVVACGDASLNGEEIAECSLRFACLSEPSRLRIYLIMSRASG